MKKPNPLVALATGDDDIAMQVQVALWVKIKGPKDGSGLMVVSEPLEEQECLGASTLVAEACNRAIAVRKHLKAKLGIGHAKGFIRVPHPVLRRFVWVELEFLIAAAEKGPVCSFVPLEPPHDLLEGEMWHELEAELFRQVPNIGEVDSALAQATNIAIRKWGETLPALPSPRYHRIH